MADESSGVMSDAIIQLRAIAVSVEQAAIITVC